MAITNLSRDELISFIKNYNGSGMSLSFDEIEAIPENLLDIIYDGLQKDEELRPIANKYQNSLLDFSNFSTNSLRIQLGKLGLAETLREPICDIFKTTILTGVRVAAEKLADSKYGQKSLFVCEKILGSTISVVDSIIQFKNKIDSRYPNFCDTIIDASVPLITGLVAVYHPPIGLALQTSGALYLAAEFLRTDNLKHASNDLSNLLNDVRSIKHLSEAHKLGEKLGDLSVTSDIKPIDLQKIGIDSNNIDLISQEAKVTPEANGFLKKVCDLAKQIIPDNDLAVEEMFSKLKNAVVENFTLNQASEKLKSDFIKLFDDQMANAKEQIKNSINQSSKIFDRIGTALGGQNLITTAKERITKILSEKYPNEKSEIAKVASIMNKKIKTVSNEAIESLQEVSNMIKTKPKINNIASESLGSGKANNLIIKKILKKETNASRGI